MFRARAALDRRPWIAPLLIVVVSAILHAHFFLEAPGTRFRWDSYEYLASARNLAAGNGFRDAHGAVEARRTPGYPLVVAAFLKAGLGVTALVFAQHVAAVLLALLVYVLTLRLAGDRLSALAAGLFVGIDAGQVYMANHVMTETAMSVLLVALIAALARFAHRQWMAPLIAGGLLLAVSVMVRPAAIYLWIPLAIWILLIADRKRVLAASVFVLCAASPAGALDARAITSIPLGAGGLPTIVGEDLYYSRAAGAVAMQRTGFEFHPLPFNGKEEFRRQFFHIQQHETSFAVRKPFHERVLGSRAPVATQAELSALDGRVARKILLSHIPGAILMFDQRCAASDLRRDVGVPKREVWRPDPQRSRRVVLRQLGRGVLPHGRGIPAIAAHRRRDRVADRRSARLFRRHPLGT